MKNHRFHGISQKHENGRFSRKKANFTENVTGREIGWSLMTISSSVVKHFVPLIMRPGDRDLLS